MRSKSSIWLFGAFLFMVGHAVASLGGPSSPHLVEIYTDNQGLYFPAGRTLYAVISEDGRMNYLDTSNHDMVVKHKVLTSSEMTKVKQLLGEKELMQFRGIVGADREDSTKDYQTNLEIVIQRKTRTQRFTMQGFDQDDGRPLPQGLNRLLCFVDGIRGDKFRVSSNCK
jgi:hypothetical protein